MKWPTVLFMLGYMVFVLGAPLSLCPKGCQCTTSSDNNLQVQCQSTKFLKSALSPQQKKVIVSLHLNNCGITKIEPSLSQLEKLKVLSLKSNKLKAINVANLPKSLDYLDVSHNSIKTLPDDLSLLTNLQRINLFGNPLSCNCETLRVRDELLKHVTFEAVAKCDSPKSLKGKPLLTAQCKTDNIDRLFGEMQGDAPYEGSGFGEEEIVTVDDVMETDDHSKAHIEEEYIPLQKSTTTTTTKAPLEKQEVSTLKTTIAPEVTEVIEELPESEGSGASEDDFKDIKLAMEESSTATPFNLTDVKDDEYDDDENEEEAYSELTRELSNTIEEPETSINMSLLNACNFNCSTPSPLDFSNETDLSPGPSIFEAAKIVLSDLNIFDDGSETTTPVITTKITEAPDANASVVTTESASENGTKIVETTGVVPEINEDTQKMKSGEVNQSNSTYIFLLVLLALVIALIVFAVFKRRSIQRREDAKKKKLEDMEEPAEEMKLLKKPAAEVNNKPNGTHETSALINGNSDNQHNGVEANDAPLTNGNKPEDDVEIRKKDEENANLLTPAAKRVTVKASEIPNSTPKTPLLVTRHLNSDGSIVTTPNTDQQM